MVTSGIADPGYEGGTATRIPHNQALWHDGSMPHTVLIVDDHPSFRSTARMLLESEGLKVSEQV